MTSAIDATEARAHLHYALLRVAGRVPDDVLVQCRSLLVDNQLSAVAQALSFTAAQYKVAMDGRDIDLLRTLVEDLPTERARVDQLEVVDGDVMPPFVFDDPSIVAKDPDTAAAALRGAAVAVAEELGVVGAWKAVRQPVGGAAWPPPRSVWTVEITDPADAVAVYARVTEALRSAGDSGPLVEIYHAGTRLPSYQDIARLRGELLWAPESEPPRLARVYDFATDGVPGFHDDHERIEPAQRVGFAEYLDAGEPLLITTALIEDIMDPDRAESVPLSFRTDGVWIWNDAVAYYLREYGMAPEADLLSHLRERSGTVPAPTGVQLHRALSALERANDEPDEPTDPPAPEDPAGSVEVAADDATDLAETSDGSAAESDSSQGNKSRRGRGAKNGRPDATPAPQDAADTPDAPSSDTPESPDR